MGNRLVERRPGIRHFASNVRLAGGGKSTCGETRRCAGLNLAKKGEPKLASQVPGAPISKE